MKATVYYVSLTDKQRDELNAGGWGSEIGKAYMRAKDGDVDQSNRHLFVKAATIDSRRLFMSADMRNEDVWVALQNREHPWTATFGVKCHTDFRRSMDVGDVIIWDNGTAERCASCGFEPFEHSLNPADWQGTHSEIDDFADCLEPDNGLPGVAGYYPD